MARAKLVEILAAGLVDSSGAPLSGGKVYTYEPGTTTDKAMYTDLAMNTPAANPIILDSAGRANVYAKGMYKLNVDDSADADVFECDNYNAHAIDGRTFYGDSSGGSSNAYTLTPDNAAGDYTAGDFFIWKANHTNTGAATMAVSGLAAKSINKTDGTTALAAGDLVQDQHYYMVYDGTRFVLLNPSTSDNGILSAGTSTGSSNAYVLSPTPSVASYSNGMAYLFDANHTNTSTATLDISGVGAKALTRFDGANLIPGDIVAGQFYIAVYDSSADEFKILLSSRQNIISMDTSTATLTNTTTQTTMTTHTIPANTIGSTGGVRFTVWGAIKNSTAGNETVRQRMYLGSTLVFDCSYSQANDNVDHMFKFVMEVIAQGSTSSQWCDGRYVVGTGGTASDAGTMFSRNSAGGEFVGGNNTVAEDATTDLAIKMDSKFSTASSNLFIAVYGSVVERF